VTICEPIAQTSVAPTPHREQIDPGDPGMRRTAPARAVESQDRRACPTHASVALAAQMPRMFTVTPLVIFVQAPAWRWMIVPASPTANTSFVLTA
jgi:hypothetical protein